MCVHVCVKHNMLQRQTHSSLTGKSSLLKLYPPLSKYENVLEASGQRDDDQLAQNNSQISGQVLLLPEEPGLQGPSHAKRQSSRPESVPWTCPAILQDEQSTRSESIMSRSRMDLENDIPPTV